MSDGVDDEIAPRTSFLRGSGDKGLEGSCGRLLGGLGEVKDDIG